jgi:hypothetical protein
VREVLAALREMCPAVAMDGNNYCVGKDNRASAQRASVHVRLPSREVRDEFEIIVDHGSLSNGDVQ